MRDIMKGFWAGVAMTSAVMPASAKVVQADSTGFVVAEAREVHRIEGLIEPVRAAFAKPCPQGDSQNMPGSYSPSEASCSGCQALWARCRAKRCPAR